MRAMTECGGDSAPWEISRAASYYSFFGARTSRSFPTRTAAESSRRTSIDINVPFHGPGPAEEIRPGCHEGASRGPLLR